MKLKAANCCTVDWLHARLNSHFKDLIYNEKEKEKCKKYLGKLFSKNQRIKGVY